MAKYTYKARDARGNLISSEMEAADEQELVKELEVKGYFLITAEIKGGAMGGDILAPFKKPKVKEITQFTVELSTLLDAGISLVAALEIEENQMKEGMLKSTLAEVVADIRHGKSFSEALAKHPKIFDKIYVGLIKAGEVSGQLDNILLDLAKFMEVSDENRSKVKSALTYPAVLIVVATAVCVFLLIAVLPSFASIFQSSGVELPLPTRILMGVSEFLKYRWYIALGSLILAFGMFKLWTSTKEGRYTFDGMKFKFPVIGPLLTKSIVSRFTRTFGALVKSSVPMLQALEILKEGAGNARMEHLVDRIKLDVSEGERISTELEKSEYIPIMVARMVAVGEDTGALDTMLLKVADYYDKELEAEIKGLTSVIEPIITVGMGIVIGAIVLAVMLPMFDMIKLVK